MYEPLESGRPARGPKRKKVNTAVVFVLRYSRKNQIGVDFDLHVVVNFTENHY